MGKVVFKNPGGSNKAKLEAAPMKQAPENLSERKRVILGPPGASAVADSSRGGLSSGQTTECEHVRPTKKYN